MGTDYRPQEKRGPPGPFRKVSKPLMEKKRRARINVSLEQLKALLEKHYSHQIRKRKLEKADILELSVKYMRSLQHSVQGLPPLPPKSADYQAGFRSCLQGVRQFLVRSEAAGAASSFLLLHDFARALPASGTFSTTDSGSPPPALPEARLASQWPNPAKKARPAKPPRARRGDASVPSGESPSQPRSHAAGGQQVRLWRPW